MKFLSMFISDDGQNLSVMRVICFMIAAISTLSVWGIWVAVCVIRRELVNIPPDVITLYIGLVATALTGKVLQSATGEK